MLEHDRYNALLCKSGFWIIWILYRKKFLSNLSILLWKVIFRSNYLPYILMEFSMAVSI